jgi:hypothetical protein
MIRLLIQAFLYTNPGRLSSSFADVKMSAHYSSDRNCQGSKLAPAPSLVVYMLAYPTSY